ncbi:PKD domain-containing protein [Adhaeribacter arboris]|nr:T9SS type A sorting domain-containing protein [Adhaeribacter arboris]
MKKIFTPFFLIVFVFFNFTQISFAQESFSKVWDVTFGGNNADILQIHRPTKDGGYILGGTSNSPVSGSKTIGTKGNQDFWIVKIDASGNKQWDKTFGGSGFDFLQDVQPTADGGYIFAGTSDSPVSGDKTAAASGKFDYWVVKVDASGNKLWDKMYGGSSNEYLKVIRLTTDGGYILGGSSDSPVSGKTGFNKTTAQIGENDYWVVKMDANGIKQWDKTIGGSSYDFLQDIQVTTDGGYIIGGQSYSGATGSKSSASKGFGDYWIVKTDGSGNKQWDKTLGGNLDETLVGILLTKDNGYVLGGISKSGLNGDKSEASKGFGDYWLVQLDAAGNKQWDKTIGGLNNDYLQVITATNDGGILLGGTSNSPLGGDKTTNSNGNSDFWLVKTDAKGLKIWDKTIGGTDYENLRSVQQTTSGSIILAGTTSSATGADKSSSSKGETDFWLVNMANGGKEQPPVLNQQVDSFTLVNADTEQDIQTLASGSTLNLATLPTRNLNIRANTSTNSLDSVVFHLSGADTLHIGERNAPYILFGAVGTNYNAWIPILGNYSLTGTTYSTTSDSDTVGTPLVVSFTVIDQPTSTDGSPIANAGTDVTVTLPTNTVTLSGTGTDTDGTIKQYIWNQVSGPSASKISNTLVANPVVSGLVAGTYVFSLVVTDSQSNVSAADFINVIVNSTTTNAAPVANAGSDITVTLPTNTLTLSGTGTDKDGTIKQYIWNQVSGPNTAKLSNSLVANPVASGLAAGTYVFSLVVTDNQSAVSAADYVSVIVNNNTSSNSQIVSLTLINGDTDKDILTITEGIVLNLATLPTKNLNIRINTSATGVGSVKLALSGRWTINKTEGAPYTLFGDEKYSNGTVNYGGLALPTGDYTLKSTPYSGSNGSGTAGTPLTVNFKIINQATSAAINYSTISQVDSTSNANSSITNGHKMPEVNAAKPASLTSFPNPFQNQTTIQFTFAQEEDYKLEVYNLSGELVSLLKSGKAVAGETVQVSWNASQNKNGIYIIKLTNKQAVQHLRVMHTQ